MPKGILNKASLVMVPEAPIDGTMPSVFPEDRSGDFTFTRGSNLAATRVASNGLIEKGRENLLLQSNNFDTTPWSGAASTLSGQSGYDGTSDAWLITKSGTFDSRRQVITNSSVGTFSVYAKAGSYNWMLLHIEDAAGDCLANFDLSTGTLGSLTNGITSKIEDVGSGWYRCSATFNRNVTDVRIYPSESGGYTGTSGNIYIQDAQLEVGLVATGYIESGATTGKAGLLENEPRIDFTGGGCGALLLEPQRSNLIIESEYFGSVNWNKQNSIRVNTNSHLSPEGIQNATELDGFDSSNFQSVSQYMNVNADAYTFSVFLKKTTGALTHYPAVVMGSIYKYVIINSTTGTYTEATGTNDNNSVTIESWDNNWWRVSLTNTLSAGAQRFAIYPSLSANGTGITTNASGANVFFGAQVEQGSYPTSYIPTYGSSVTRSEDIGAQLNFSNFFDGYDFTMFLELADNDSLIRANSSNNFRISDTGGNNNGAIRIYRASSNATAHRVVFQDNSGNFNPFAVFIDGDSPKVLVRRIYNTGEFKVFVNGVLKLTATNTDYDMFRFIDFAGGGSSMSIKQIALFPTALTDEECSALTQP